MNQPDFKGMPTPRQRQWGHLFKFTLWSLGLFCAGGMIVFSVFGGMDSRELIEGRTDFSLLLAGFLGIVGLGLLHYAIWGLPLSKQLANERKAQRIKELLETEEYRDDSLPWKHD